jgi:hypothetical protein
MFGQCGSVSPEKCASKLLIGPFVMVILLLFLDYPLTFLHAIALIFIVEMVHEQKFP